MTKSRRKPIGSVAADKSPLPAPGQRGRKTELTVKKKKPFIEPLMVPGKVVNKGGRPAGYAEMMAYCREFGIEAVDVLVGILRDKNEAPQIRATVACALIDRGYGKPTQAHMVQIEEDPDPSSTKRNAVASVLEKIYADMRTIEGVVDESD